MVAALIESIRGRSGPWLPATVATLLLFAALWVLHRELRHISYQELRNAIAALPPSNFMFALLFCASNYLVLTTYDRLAFFYIGLRIASMRVALTAFISYAVSNSVGFALLSGTAIRHRFYSRWGVATADLSRIVVFNATTYWLGLLMLGACSLVFYPHNYLQGGLAQSGAQWLGMACLAMATGYVILPLLRRDPLRVHGFEMRVPSLRLTLGQLLVSTTDWTLAAAVLYVLLPPHRPSYGVVLGAFLAAQVVGLISHVPGGLGVFDGVMVLLLSPYLPSGQLIAALVLYRLVYYVIPLMLALLLLIGWEIGDRGARLLQLGQSLGSYSVQFAPRLLSVFTFMAGLLLLLSGATPAEQNRLLFLSHMLPLGLFEASHFLGSVVGVALLILAQAVSRRIQLAYHLAIAGLVAGILASLLKAGDWEEAALLACLLVVFIRGRRLFDRRAALTGTRFSPGWVIAIAAAFGSSIWMGIFAFRHVGYSSELWWQVALQQDAPRFLRASLGAAMTLFAFGIWRLLQPIPHIAAPPSAEALSDAERIIHAQAETLPLLVWLRDKALLFNSEHTAFIMYGVRGRTWVALGDPVGPVTAAPALLLEFVERADDYGAVPVFYQIHSAHLHHYADLGMAFAKFGEEAKIPLKDFSLAGSPYKALRSALNRMRKENIDFRIIEAKSVAAILPQLKAISDDWLARKSASEKGFSLGYFFEDYLSRLPVAVLEHDGRIVAFANLLCGPTGQELSIDLMRFSAKAPRGAMEALLTHLLVWGQENGYQWFNLGMAPLSGLHQSAVSPFWTRLAGFVYRHGDAFYNFKGLRAYKEKFHPVWEPRYMAYPGGKAFPLILTDIAALSAGGYWRIFR